MSQSQEQHGKPIGRRAAMVCIGAGTLTVATAPSALAQGPKPKDAKRDTAQKTTGKATLVVTATPNPKEMASVQAYLKGVLPLLQGAGGKLVKRLKVAKTVKGDAIGMVLVMDFDSADAIGTLFDSKDYAALVPVRDRGFKAMNILLTQEM